MIGGAFLLVGGQALGDDSATIASTTQFEAHAINVTPPDEIGFSIYIKIAGRIATTSHSRVVKSCRVDRTVFITWTRVDGGPVGPIDNATYPSSRRGYFSAEMSFDYDRDVPHGGGPFKITITTPRSHVAGKRLGTTHWCRRLTETLEVDIPPAAT